MISLEDVRVKVASIIHPDEPYFLSVSDALSLADAMENFDAVPPAAYVSTGVENALQNKRATGPVLQKVNSSISVAFCLGAERADGERVDQAEVARGLILQALVGFSPAGAARSLEYKSYRMVATGGGLLWGEVLFEAPWTLQASA